MNLQGRNLSEKNQGDDVALLQKELAELGFRIDPAESTAKLFGPTTTAAVTQFQKGNGVASTGIVDPVTARLINARVDALPPGPVPVPRPAPIPNPLPRPVPGPIPQPAPTPLPAPSPVGRVSNAFIVRGQVLDPGDRPVVNISVRAFDKDLRTEEELGGQATDAQGRYSISYNSSQFARSEKGTADLIVRAFDPSGKIVVESAVLFNARPVETVDLAVSSFASSVSEWERYGAVLAPLLNGVAPADFTEDDITFLNGETRIDALRLAYFASAYQQANLTKLPPEVFYGWFRQNLPTNLSALIVQNATRLRAALVASLADNIIPSALAGQIDALIATLQGFVGAPFAATPGVSGPDTARELLAVAGLSAALQGRFLNAYLSFQGPIEDFWKSLRANPDLKDSVDALQSTLQLGLLTDNNTPLVSALRAKNITNARQLAQLGEDGFRALVASSADILSRITPAFDGETDDQKSTRYAASVMEVLTETIPTAFLAARFAQINSTDPTRQDLAKFLSNVPDLELRDDNLDTFIVANGSAAFQGVRDQVAVTAGLKRYQRILRIAPSADHADLLFGAGLDSARAVASLAKPAFLAQFGAQLGGAAQAVAYYNKAQQVTSSVNSVMTNVQQSVNDLRPAAMGKASAGSANPMPNFTSLFGSYSFCDCEDCRSVYSPAAYLVDILQYLNPASGAKPIDVLLNRRPDLEFIPLTCENTNTELPYIDLVNEILEFYIAHNFQLDGTAARDTGDASASDLSVTPEYTIDAAYDLLKQAVYPPSLPFDRSLALERMYFTHLGRSRYQVMRLFQRNGAPLGGDIDNESLEISLFERDILIGADSRPVREFYGYTTDSVTYTDPNAVPTQTVSEPWQTNLARVPEFLRRVALTYSELLDLLATDFANPGKLITMTEAGNNPHCDLTETTLNNLGPSLTKIHRFVRLARKLGWSFPDVDKLFLTFQATDITSDLLQKLACAARLKVDLNLAIDPLLSLWGNIPVAGTGSLYNTLFLNKAVFNPTDGAFILSQPPANPEIIGDGLSPLTIAAHAAALLAAFRLGAQDFSLLLATNGLDATSAPLTLATVSRLYRFTVLSRALNVRLNELISLLALTGIDPFAAGNPLSTADFVARVTQIKQSGFTTAQLDYLYRHHFDPLANLDPRQDSMDLLIKQLQDGLKEIVEETTVALDPLGDALRLWLATVIESTLLSTALDVIDGVSTLPNPGVFIDQYFLPFLNTADAKTVLLDTSNPDVAARQQANRSYVLQKLLVFSRNSLNHGFIKQTLSDNLSTDSTLISALVEIVLKSASDPTQPAIIDFLSLLGDGLQATYYDDINLANLKFTRVDATVAFDWGTTGSPDPQTVPPASYSAKWTGKLFTPLAEDYSFFIRTGGGVRLLVDGQVQIDQWTQPPTVVEYSITLPMLAQTLHTLELQFFKTTGQGAIELDWSSASTARAVIPQTQLYSRSDYSLEAALTSYRRLQKAAMLINGFRISPEELLYLSEHGSDFGGFDVNLLPLDPAVFTSALFISWERLSDFCALRDQVPANEGSLLDVFAASSVVQAVTTLKLLTGWDSDNLDYLVGLDGFNLQPSDFKNEEKLLILQACLALSDRLGASCERLFVWAGTGQTSAQLSDQAKEIINTAKAKYDPDAWLTIAKPLNDTLRESQKAALIAYLLASQKMEDLGISDSDQLFSFFLIDVDMTACMLTSRIKQAISSVQLFIQSCLMHLEPGVDPSLIDHDEWNSWMKSYRVWEANRQIFLYPENWIEPELRDDKSPFFEELETQLLQNDITADTAEQAFLDYLEKLEEVGRLQICGICEESISVFHGIQFGDSNTLHVFGRTPDSPHTYYYRRLSAGVWSPWEKVNMDIEGDHLIPVVQNGALFLFWPHFEETADEDQNLTGPFIQTFEHYKWQSARDQWDSEHQSWQQSKAAHDQWAQSQSALDAFDKENGLPSVPLPEPPLSAEPEEPSEPAASAKPALTHREIKLAWSVYKQGKWTAKRTSKDAVWSPHLQRTLEDFGLYYSISEDDQWTNFLHNVGTKDTISTVYLPEPEKHFFRTRLDGGDTVVDVYRRYWHYYAVLDRGHDAIKGFEYLGNFRLGCGNQVLAETDYVEKDYDTFSLPDENVNSFMSFIDEGSSTLSFSTNGKSLEVLNTVPAASDPYDIVYESQRAAFALKPAFQTFFYQDKQKAYYVHNQLESPRRFISNLSQAFLDFNYASDNVLIAATKLKYAVGSEFASSQSRERSPRRESSAIDDANAGSASAKGTAIGTRAIGIAAKPSDESAFSASSGVSELSAMKSFQYGLLDKVSALIGLNIVPYLKFETFFHPHLCAFNEALLQSGVPGLLTLANQQRDNDVTDAKKNVFADLYTPGAIVDPSYPRENVDFEGGAYSGYNWELFFHIPMRVAISLSQNQQFEDAQAWFHFIFNPTTSSAVPPPERYWNTLPFFKHDPTQDQIQNLLSVLDSADPSQQALKNQVLQQISEWRSDPFNPHLIARLRITAYQKNVVMKYIDNLIAWGDQLFSQDTIESINEATLLYVLANSILGPRPTSIPSSMKVDPQTYHDLRGHLDAFSNALVPFENQLPYTEEPLSTQTTVAANSGNSIKSVPETLYFCTPKNDQLLGYWDTVADRLFKIRNCMNIDGLARQLPLFEPPIDPALLVKAAAAGLDLSSVLSDLNAPLPCYRFSFMLQRASDLCNELKGLGNALLSALEKKDGEALSALRAGHESALLRAVRDLKQQQIDEANVNLEGLKRSRVVTETRRDFYRDIVRINSNEQAYLDNLGKANVFNNVAQGLQLGVAALHIIPSFDAGTSGMSASPVVTATFGGDNLGNQAQAIAQVATMIANIHTHNATMASIKGGYDRRWDDWKQQETLADKELEQIDQQIAAGGIRVSIAQTDLVNQDQQIENSQAVEDFLQSKYTNEDLYGWMVTQVSKVFFQSYKLAYDLAKKAEKTFRFERGLTDSNYIQFGYWDNLKKGLLAGEQLGLDLKRLEGAYLDQNKREFELTKQISLLLQDPMALISLKETGQCEIFWPETLFDADYPGHYMRRVKSVGLTLPCVVGPYTSINCTLVLLSNKTRINSLAGSQYSEDVTNGDDRFVTNFTATQSIATSHAQNDNGMFELNFRDERYLPFEGAGAVSRWRIELPKDTNAFDLNTLTDLIVHLKYTARDGGDVLRTAAKKSIQDALAATNVTPLARLFSLKHEFPGEWYKFWHPVGTPATLALDLSQVRFPFYFRGKTITINGLKLFVGGVDGVDTSGLTFNVSVSQKATLNSPDQPLGNLQFAAQASPLPGVPFCELKNLSIPLPTGLALSALSQDAMNLFQKKSVDDIWVVLLYSVN